MIQKEIIHIFGNKVCHKICHDIGDSKFCIIIDKARDESIRKHMTIVLRYVNNKGFMRECFLGLAHVKDTTITPFTEEICVILSQCYLDVKNIYGQGYDGSNNMQGEWNGF